MNNDASSFVFGLVILIYTLVNLSILAEVGQRLIDANTEVYKATYECNWYEQSLKFQKALLIMREVMIKELNIKIAGGWTLKRKAFITVGLTFESLLDSFSFYIICRSSTQSTITTTTSSPTLES
jgi:hypothetical protein